MCGQNIKKQHKPKAVISRAEKTMLFRDRVTHKHTLPSEEKK